MTISYPFSVRCSRTTNTCGIIPRSTKGEAEMLKPQDCVILLKLLANPKVDWSQRQLALTLGISLAEVNAGIKRLVTAGLLRSIKPSKFVPIINAAEEFLIYGLKYFFPAKLGEYTRGTPTGIAAPLFQNKIALGNDPVPVWPDAVGKQRGISLPPIHASIPKALRQNPDKNFYELLALIDVIRIGRARERNLAIQFLKNKLQHEK